MSDDEKDEQGMESLHRDILQLKNELAGEVGEPTRRDFVVGGAALLAGGALVATSGTAAAQATPGGNVGSASNPALKVYTDVFHFNERTSDPSSPEDGEMWYNSSA